MKLNKILLCAGLCGSMLFTACGQQQVTGASEQQTETSTDTPTPEETEEVIEEETNEISGIIKSFTGGMITLITETEETLEFDLADATLECENGILAGNEVTVTYEGTINGSDARKATATLVTDRKGQEAQPKAYKMVGTVADATTNTLTIKNEDGDEITFVTTGTKMKCTNGMEPGNWVIVKYEGEIKGVNAKNVNVLSIKDTGKKVDKALSQVEIAPMPMERTVFTSASAQLRENYTLDSDVVATVGAGLCLTQTGETDTGWVRVEYNNQEAYIYEQYLSDVPTETATPTPKPTETDEELTMYATVTEVDSGTLTVSSQENDETYVFSWSQTEINMPNGMSEGSNVVLSYMGQASKNPYTADLIKVSDQTLDEDAPNAKEEATASVTGTVMATSVNTITVAADDGAQITFSIEDAQLEAKRIPEIGEYVVVEFRANNASNIHEAVEIRDVY